MTEHGAILVHVYFVTNFRELKEAVVRFARERLFTGVFPIGDGISIIVV